MKTLKILFLSTQFFALASSAFFALAAAFNGDMGECLLFVSFVAMATATINAVI